MKRSFFTKLEYRYSYGIFIERPNRFVAFIEHKNKRLKSHVPDPGRLKELLIPGRKVLLRISPTQEKLKTDAALIGVFDTQKKIWVSLDSQLANRFIKHSWQNLPMLKDYQSCKPEFSYGKSRLDFLFIRGKEKLLVEVKTATLVKDGVALFPDAPTLRGVRHVKELISATKDRYLGAIVFVVPRNDAQLLKPNKTLHPEFHAIMKEATDHYIQIMILKCDFTPDGLKVEEEIPFSLD